MFQNIVEAYERENTISHYNASYIVIIFKHMAIDHAYPGARLI